jgi:hypothetical protein
MVETYGRARTNWQPGRILWVMGGTVRLRFLEKGLQHHNHGTDEAVGFGYVAIEYGELLQRPDRLGGEL